MSLMFDSTPAAQLFTPRKRNPRKQVIVKKSVCPYEEITEINDYILLIFKFL